MKTELEKYTRVKIWRDSLEEYIYGSVLGTADLPSFYKVCLDDDIEPYRIFPASSLEFETPRF